MRRVVSPVRNYTKQEVLQVRRSGNSSTIKRVIVVLAILLALSLAALCVLWRHYRSVPSAQVSGNRITAQTTAFTQTAPQRAALTPLSASANDIPGKASDIQIDKRVPSYGEAFHAGNMFPGDSIAQYYRVRVYHTGTVTVHFNAAVQSDTKYQKLAEVLMIRVSVDGTVVYDGLMRDMPQSVDTALSGDYLDYTLNVYLDTSVGNDYMNKELMADFRWWVEGTGHRHPDSGNSGSNGDDGQLINGPKTGDSFSPLLWGGLAVCAAAGLGAVVVLRRRKEGGR